MAETIALRIDSIEHVSMFDGKPVDKVFVVMGDSSYYFDCERVEQMEDKDPEPPAAERVPMLDVTHMDDTMGYYPLPRGYRIDSASRTLVIKGAKGEPPTRIPLDNVRYWTTRTP